MIIVQKLLKGFYRLLALEMDKWRQSGGLLGFEIGEESPQLDSLLLMLLLPHSRAQSTRQCEQASCGQSLHVRAGILCYTHALPKCRTLSLRNLIGSLKPKYWYTLHIPLHQERDRSKCTGTVCPFHKYIHKEIPEHKYFFLRKYYLSKNSCVLLGLVSSWNLTSFFIIYGMLKKTASV